MAVARPGAVNHAATGPDRLLESPPVVVRVENRFMWPGFGRLQNGEQFHRRDGEATSQGDLD
jgi:hypothetical protein